MSSDAELAGKVALVTGGGRGIGRGIALELAGAGARVAVSARTREQVEATAAEVGGIAIEADVSERADVERMVATAEEELGPLDLLVNNAGIALWEEAAWEIEPEEWWHVLEVNVLGVYLCCRAVIPGMIERGGGPHRQRRERRRLPAGQHVDGLQRQQGRPCTASARRSPNQLEPHGIPVFSISPGLVRTESDRRQLRRRRAVDAAGAGAAARARARLGPPRRPLRALPPCRARRHRRRRPGARRRSSPPTSTRSASGADLPTFRAGVDLGATKIQAVVVGPDHAVVGPGAPPDADRRAARRRSRAKIAAAVTDGRRVRGRRPSKSWAASESARPAPSTRRRAPSSTRATSPTGRSPFRSPRRSQTRSARRCGSTTTSRSPYSASSSWAPASRTPRSSASGGAPASAAASCSTGSSGSAAARPGEIGHMVVKRGGARCPCGRRGCLEAYAGRGAMEARARELVERGHKTDLFDLMKKRGAHAADERRLGGRARARRQDGQGRSIHRAVGALGAGIASAVNLLDVEAVVIGGGLGTRLGEPYVERIAHGDEAAPVRRRSPAGLARRPRSATSAAPSAPPCSSRSRRRVPAAGDRRSDGLEQPASFSQAPRARRTCSAAFFEAPCPVPTISPSIVGRAREAAVVRRPVHRRRPRRSRPRARGGRAPPGARSCSRRGPRARSRCAPGRRRRSARGWLEAVLEVERAQAGLDERGEDVAVRGEAQQLIGVDRAGVAGEELPQPHALADDRAALARDDVRADLREPALRLVGEAIVELLGDREPEDAVPEELQPLVGVSPAGRPRGVREGVAKALGRKRLDQGEEGAPRP